MLLLGLVRHRYTIKKNTCPCQHTYKFSFSTMAPHSSHPYLFFILSMFYNFFFSFLSFSMIIKFIKINFIRVKFHKQAHKKKKKQNKRRRKDKNYTKNKLNLYQTILRINGRIRDVHDWVFVAGYMRCCFSLMFLRHFLLRSSPFFRF